MSDSPSSSSSSPPPSSPSSPPSPKPHLHYYETPVTTEPSPFEQQLLEKMDDLQLKLTHTYNRMDPIIWKLQDMEIKINKIEEARKKDHDEVVKEFVQVHRNFLIINH